MADVLQEEPLRSPSPSPSLSPTTASSLDPQLDRSMSTVSSFASSCTSVSNGDNTNGDASSKRRGYNRPQATIFADSARNRDSVMSLGTIAHLQHYFARTGLLDGKGAQLAKEDKDGEGISKLLKARRMNTEATRSVSNSYGPDAYSSSQFASDEASPRPSSPAYSISSNVSANEPRLLNMPPTVSTYRQKQQYIPPPPNPSVLRRELREALEDAKKVLVEAREEGKLQDSRESKAGSSPSSDSPPTQGWHEIEGLHILDLVTLAIKAAKNYYTSHEQPLRLYAIRSERRIRSDLYAVLEVLKKVAARNFAGGYREREIDEILRWISGIDELVTKDEKAAKKEQEKRESWMWLNGNCNGHEREREWVFLKSFEPSGVFLPVWTEPPPLSEGGMENPGGFLLSLRDGVNLVQLHNELVKNSWRQFGEIKKWHTDTSKPYRCMENLRYWLKAAELRWDVVLDVNVSGVVQGKDAAAWKGFDEAILKWSKAVREELTLEWKEHRETTKPEQPLVQVGPNGESVSGETSAEPQNGDQAEKEAESQSQNPDAPGNDQAQEHKDANEQPASEEPEDLVVASEAPTLQDLEETGPSQ